MNPLKKELYELVRSDNSIFEFFQSIALDGLWYWEVEKPENVWMNPRFWLTLGYDPSEVQNMPSAWRQIHPDDLSTALDNLTKHFEDSNYPFHQVVRYTHKNGSTVWIRCRGLAIRNTRGEAIRMLVSYVDISREKENEQKYGSLFNSIDEGFCIVEMIFDDRKKPVDYRFLAVNAAFESQTGLRNAVGKRMREFAPNHEEHWFEIYGKIALTGESVRFENRAEQLHRWYDVYAFRFGDPQNYQVAILFNDITERKKTQEKLAKLNEELERKVDERTQELQNNYRELLDYKYALDQSNIVAITDQKGTIQYANENFCKISRYTKDELLGQDHRIVNSGYHPKEFIRDLWGTIARGKIWRGELKNKAKDGTTYWVDTTIVPFLNEKGKPYQYLAIRTDITDRKKTEEELQMLNSSLEVKVDQRTAELASTNKELEAFSYSVAHDLRAPLRLVHGYAEMLSQDYVEILDSEGKRIIENVKRNASKMGRLIDDLLSFSRLGRTEMQLHKIDMDELVKGVLLEINKFTVHKARIVANRLHPVRGDHNLLFQVMYNLISNAIKYSSKKESPVIEITSVEENGELVFLTKDNGAGFDMKYAHKLFGVFQRLHTEREFEGTGIGLAIVSRIITRHGGKIWAEGKVEEGAAFYFTLPAIDSEH